MRRLLDVDLRLIRIFRAIAEAQGMAGAELVLNLSQSRISAGLAELEARLGVRLCRRGRAGFALTEAGVRVYEASQDLFEAVDRFCNSAGAVSANLRRVLRLGTVDAIVTNGDLWLSRILLRFRRQAPGGDDRLLDRRTGRPRAAASRRQPRRHHHAEPAPPRRARLSSALRGEAVALLRRHASALSASRSAASPAPSSPIMPSSRAATSTARI